MCGLKGEKKKERKEKKKEKKNEKERIKKRKKKENKRRKRKKREKEKKGIVMMDFCCHQAGRKNLEMTYVRSEFENGSESDEQARSDPSEDDGYNVVIADNCRRIFVYGLKLLWTIDNRNAVWSWVGELSKAFALPKPSPSRQYAQRKLPEGTQMHDKNESLQDDASKSSSTGQGASSSIQKEASGSDPSLRSSSKAESQSFSAIGKCKFALRFSLRSIC